MKISAVALLCLALASCRGVRLQQVSDCGRPCYGGAAVVAGIGACAMGTWSCDGDGGMTCVGWVPPQPEECDGIDNNCDGLIDTPITTDPHWCDTACGRGLTQCQHGHWTKCSVRDPSPEVCNGIDDDCDGVVDNNLPVQYCYDGPGMTAAFGVCHPGGTRCFGGVQTCFGEVVPSAEVCDGIDNNCDGQIDEGSSPNEVVDIVIVFDNSGSMAVAAGNLKAATQTWVTKYASNLQRRYALVAAPDNDSSITVPTLVSNFTDAAGLAAAVQLQSGSTGSGSEPTLDALMEISGSANVLHLNWRAGSKRVIIVFSDEEPQTYATSSPCFAYCPAVALAVSGQLAQAGIVLDVFTSATDASAWPEWKSLASTSGGQEWDINASTADLETSLDALLKNVTCGP